MVEGEELMQVADTSRLNLLEEYNKDNDVIFWKIPRQMMEMTLKKGDYIVLYPENAHRGAIKYGKCKSVLKIVGKVKC